MDLGWITAAQIAAGASVAGLLLTALRWFIDHRREQEAGKPQFEFLLAPEARADGWRVGKLLVRHDAQVPLMVERITIAQPFLLAVLASNVHGAALLPPADEPSCVLELDWSIRPGARVQEWSGFADLGVMSSSPSKSRIPPNISVRYRVRTRSRRYTKKVKAVIAKH